jgi:hypothetical protein
LEGTFQPGHGGHIVAMVEVQKMDFKNISYHVWIHWQLLLDTSLKRNADIFQAKVALHGEPYTDIRWLIETKNTINNKSSGSSKDFMAGIQRG